MNARAFRVNAEGGAVFLRLLLGLGVMLLLHASQVGAAGLSLVLCVWLDAGTGWIARRYGPKSADTAAIENHADMLCFVIAPMGFAAALSTHVAVLVLLPVFLVAGVYRLSRFQVEGLVNHRYRGMPVTYNGYWFPLAGGVVHFSPAWGTAIPAITLLVTSALMTSRHLSVPEY